MRSRLLLLNIAFLLHISTLSGQYYDTGQDPASLKWLQIKTNNFTVIYPESYGSEGLVFAKSLDDSFAKLSALYPIKRTKIPVIIHNYTTISNGYVAWAPKRMEIYPTPGQNTIPLGSVEQLTTHELTHVLQMYSLNQGFTKSVSVISGEQFPAIISLFLPLWFMEGDAVFAESVLSQSGRGRSASFQKQLKAIALENPKMYSYDKMLWGSFRRFTPDDYQYGYQMIAWSYAKYDPQLWNKTLDFTARQPFTLIPVNVSLNRTARLTKAKLYSETFDSLKVIWQKDESSTNSSYYEALNPSKKGEYINYLSPVFVGKDSIIAIKTSLFNPPSFVLIDPSSKSEKRIHTPGDMYPWFLSGSKGKIVWIENQPDLRWDNRNYSVIKIMDLNQKKTHQLTRYSRYLSASISPDGNLIAAAENSVENKNSIVILDANNGDIIRTMEVPDNVYPQRPHWSYSGAEISVVFLSEKGEGVMLYSLGNKTWTTLIEAGRDDLQDAYLRNDSLFYVSSLSGTDNIYILSTEKKTTKLTNSKYGAYDVCLDNGDLFFSDYSPFGTNICQINLKEITFVPAAGSSKNSFLINRFDTFTVKTSGKSLTDYSPDPYRKWQHLFNFHSWMPLYADIEEIQSDPTIVRPGLTVMTQNHLSTLISTLGYEYSADKRHKLHSRITWKGWYPVFESQLDYGDEPIVRRFTKTDPDPVSTFPGLKFTNTIYFPLTLSTGKFTRYFRPSFSSSYDNQYIYLSNKKVYDYGQTRLSGRMFFYNSQKSAIRDIYPRWTQVIDFNYTFAPYDKNIYGPVKTLKTAFFFPGFIRNHGIKIRYETEKQNPEKLILSNIASFPRGYLNIISENLNFLSADYSMPLLYPDISVPTLLYIKRIRGTLFHDYARGTKNRYYDLNGVLKEFHNYSETFRSFGFQLLSDFYILRIPFMISAGVQTTWKDFNDSPAFELLLNVDIFGMKIGKNRL